jgi:hypothetical protein
MQTLAFLWYELKAAKRHVKEAVAEPQHCGKVDFSLLNSASYLHAIDKDAQRRRHLSLHWIAKKEAGLGCGPFLQERH